MTATKRRIKHFKAARLRPRQLKTFHRLQSMACYEEFHYMVCAGVRLTDLVHWLQEVQGEFKDLSAGRVRNIIQRYRRDVPDAELSLVMPELYSKAVIRMSEGLKVLEEMEKAYAIQARRVAIGFQNEELAGTLHPNMHKEMKVVTEQLVAYHKVQAELGLVEKNLGKLTVESQQTSRVLIAQQYGPVAGKVSQRPKNVNNVLSLFQKVRALSLMPDEGLEPVIDAIPEPEEDEDESL